MNEKPNNPEPEEPNPRGYYVLTRKVKRDGKEIEVREAYNPARREMADFKDKYEKQTGRKLTNRQLKRLKKLSRQQGILQAAVQRAAQEEKDKAADVGVDHPQRPAA